MLRNVRNTLMRLEYTKEEKRLKEEESARKKKMDDSCLSRLQKCILREGGALEM